MENDPKPSSTKIQKYEDKIINWASWLRDVKYSLSFLLRNKTEKFTDETIKKKVQDDSEDDL